ncbi:MAG: sulfatase [Planctomycetes bacterium]|nr:sulfatase [Planctomycetota bacterium]
MAPRVILIVIDTLRADRLGCYEYERPTSPTLDELAGESVLFETVMAQSAFTLISHKSMFTSRYPLQLAQETTNANLQTLAALKDPEDFLVSTFRNLKTPLLTDGLRQHGYVTTAFTDGGWMSRDMGFDPYFDTYNDEAGHLAAILPRAYRWMYANRDRPFFSFIHTYDTHAPYVSREPYDSMFCHDHSQHISLEGRCAQVDCGAPPLMKIELTPTDVQAVSDHYDGSIACADAYLKECFNVLRGMELYDETLLIVTSDHGEALGEHEQIGHGGLYLEHLLVPLIIKFPASWNVPAARISNPVELVDVMATVYDACGLELPVGAAGRSLLPLIRGGRWARRHLVAQTSHMEGRGAKTSAARRAVLEPGRWLLIHDAQTDTQELFDLIADPLGLTNVAGRVPPPAELFRALLTRDVTEVDEEFAVPEGSEMTEEQLRRLRSLGYVGD